MGFWNKIGKVSGHIFDLRVDRWMGYQNLKNTTQYFINQTKALFKLKHSSYSETFEEAVERLELTPDMLEEQSQRFAAFTTIFLLVAVLLVLYGSFLFLKDNWMGGLICIILAVYALSCAFRFHFWYFQIKQKKLGCSIREWWTLW